MKTRFAPSPTGYLHLGHAFAAARAFDFAKDHKGQCLLRIEDIDHTRCKVDFAQAIYEDLAWLGFDWPLPARVQTDHLSDYQAVLDGLRARGLIYPCFKTRRQIAALLDDKGRYRASVQMMSEDEIAARLQDGQACAWRLSIARVREVLGDKARALSYTDCGAVHGGVHAVDIDSFGDEVLGRRDIGVSYHLACVHDDAAQAVTDIVRGADFIALTGFQVLLQAVMGAPTPRYHHHALLFGEDGKKLSKSAGAPSIRSLREQGMGAVEVIDLAVRRDKV